MANIAKDLDIALKVAEEGAKIARKAKVKPTVKEAERIAYPGIYDDPRVIAEKAASRVAPESPAMKQLFGVTREDLYDIGKERKGNLPGILPGAAENPKGSKAAEKIMTKKNEQRLLDAFAESEKYPELIRGMDPWYVMDPLYKHMVQLVGPERAAEEYKKFNTLLGMASPGSEVTTEIPRGTAAYFLQKEGRFPEFEKYLGVPSAKRLEMEEFPTDILNVPGHMYHKTAHSTPMAKFLETGKLEMESPKVPMYIEASGVPETGFQTDVPVGDAHWSRAVGLGDTRTAKNFGASVSTPEMSMLAPWWREKVAGEAGLESVPAQARAWGLFSPQTGVTTPIGKPKLEMIADKIMETADRLKISPEDARDLVLTGKTYAGKAGGGAIKAITKAVKVGEKAIKEAKHTIPEIEQPFIGYLKKSGDHESYSHDAAKAVDYHHSHLMKDPDAMFADDALTFVRYEGEPVFTIKGESVIDPYHPDSAKHISTLAEMLKRNGADPNLPFRIEDLALPREEAPYQGKQIGTLQDWIDMPKNKYAGGGAIKALDKAIKVGEQAIKEAKNYKPTKGMISELKDYVRDAKGEYGAQRVERAADLVPNLEKQFSSSALRQAFIDDNASSLLVMPPKDFEKFAAPLPEWYGKSIEATKFEGGKQIPITIPPLEESYLIKQPYGKSYEEKKMAPEEYFKHLGSVAREHGFNDIPFLKFDEGLYKDPTMVISGHEGRHRSRALDKLGDEATLVKLYPEYSFREGMPRGTQEEYLQALEEMFGQKSLVEPQRLRNPKTGTYDYRSLERLPEFFAEGGSTADGGSTHRQDKPLDPARQKPSFFPKDSKPHKQGFPIEYEEYYPRSTKPESELLDQFRKDELTAKDYLRAAPTIAKTAGKMLKEQAKEELPTYLEPRAIPDIALDALATGVGSISDLAFLGSGVDRPPLGSEQLMDLLNEYGLTSGVKRPLAENLLTIASPKVARTAEVGINKLLPIVERNFTPITTTVEAVAPDLAKFKPKDFQEYVTNRMISSQYGGTPMNIMGDEITSKLPAQGVYFNEAGQLETNPMMAIDVPNIKDISKAKELRSDIASAGEALNQESMAGIRFLPIATNKLEDASAILVKPKSGKITNEDVIKLGNEFGNSMVVSHNPRLGGVVLAPFGEPGGELQVAKSKIKDLFGSDMHIKAGHSDLQKDRFYMPKAEYAQEGARQTPRSTKELRQELKRAEALRYREPSFLSETNPLTGGIGD